MCTVRVGQPRAEADERRRRRCRWRGRPRRRSSSRAAEHAGQRLRPPRASAPSRPGSGPAAGGTRPARPPASAAPQAVDVEPVVVDVDADDLAARAGRGGRAAAGSRGARRRPGRRGAARPGRPGRGRPSPRRPRSSPRAGTATTPRSSLLQRRQHRVVEVARRQRLLADPRRRPGRGRAAAPGRACPTTGRARSARGPR